MRRKMRLALEILIVFFFAGLLVLTLASNPADSPPCPEVVCPK